ncbi:hypothetical protein C8R46DRAFT_1080632 [Mycena filopes]|nr:hypothetical protein C8R46DRAFT_1080632 [Mycena filopes]
MSATLARTSRLISDVTLAARLTHVSTLGRSFHLSSLHDLLTSSEKAAKTVQSLCIQDGGELPPSPYHGGWGTHDRIGAWTYLPDIIRACPNLRMLACPLAYLEWLGCVNEGFHWPAPPHIQLVLIGNTKSNDSWAQYWRRICKTPHGPENLRNITHLHFTHHCNDLERTFPAAHLPNLTHFAMLSHRTSKRNTHSALSTEYYSAHIRDFATQLKHLRVALRLTAVAVLWPAKADWPRLPASPWPPLELVQTAREAHVLVYCVPRARGELEFWGDFLRKEEDIWVMARRQMEATEGTDPT